jgi:hypothetical protein
MARAVFLCALCAGTLIGPAWANETVTYTYDALGRLTQVSHAGTVNNGLQASYIYDAADNRTNVTVSGAPMALARAKVARAAVRAKPRKRATAR